MLSKKHLADRTRQIRMLCVDIQGHGYIQSRMLLKTMSRSTILTLKGSVLIFMAYIATKGHKDSRFLVLHL